VHCCVPDLKNMDKRRGEFKKASAGGGSSESRLRAQGEEMRKEKRTLAKRIRSLPLDSVAASLPVVLSMDEIVSKVGPQFLIILL